MRFYFLLSTLFFSLPATAQAPKTYAKIDQHALAASTEIAEDLEQLTAYLLQKSTNDYEKVRSFFVWTANSIEFDQRAYKGNKRRINHSVEDILQRKKAVCFGYSQLLQEFFRRAEIRSEMISGYSKPAFDSQPEMKAPDHSWNAVRIEGEWYLLDVTWSSPDSEEVLVKEDYFLSPPKQFVKSHLPENPTWQLLDFPISIAQFVDGSDNHQRDSSSFLNFRDSIARYERLSPPLQKLHTAVKSYQFNPTPLLARELSASYLDYESELDDQALHFQQQKQYDSLLLVQLEMIQLCDQASRLSRLFPAQQENCAYNHFNYAVALASNFKKNPSADPLKNYREMLYQFETAHSRLSQLDSNLFTERALERCKDYIEYCNKRIQYYSR